MRSTKKMSYLDTYLEAWQIHCTGSIQAADAMVAAADPAVRYADINLPDPFVGHAGIRDMCRLASGLLPSANMLVQERVCVESTWATKWEMRGTGGESKSPYRIFGASWGTLSEDGRVASQLDYWNPSHFKDQVGIALF
jgi:hypothetical protein